MVQINIVIAEWVVTRVARAFRVNQTDHVVNEMIDIKIADVGVDQTDKVDVLIITLERKESRASEKRSPVFSRNCSVLVRRKLDLSLVF